MSTKQSKDQTEHNVIKRHDNGSFYFDSVLK